jgi:hypothetical protein
MINKDAVRVGDGTQVDPFSNCIMYRKYITFEGNREAEYIKIFYNEWLQYPSGQSSEVRRKSYLVIDIPAITHIVSEVAHLDDNHVKVVDSLEQTIVDAPATTAFTDWFSSPIIAKADGLYIAGNMTAPSDYAVGLGKDLIVGAINNALKNLPFDAKDGYTVSK